MNFEDTDFGLRGQQNNLCRIRDWESERMTGSASILLAAQARETPLAQAWRAIHLIFRVSSGHSFASLRWQTTS